MGADKSAMGAVNRPLRLIDCLQTFIHALAMNCFSCVHFYRINYSLLV